MSKINIKNKITILTGKILILLQIFLVLFTVSVKADYQEFKKQLNTMWIDVSQIESSDKISRYELANLLNTVECNDCINTSKKIIAQYDNKFWDAFLNIPGSNFDDIKYKWALYKNKTYYYCVAYVWDNQYMRWYPAETSPICWWKFCGESDTTQAEFYQVVINISAKYIYKNFLADWKAIKKWMDKLKKWSYAEKYLNQLDKEYINENAKLNKLGYLDDSKYFATYMKYCMFNIKDCGFQEIWNIKQAVWPIAELNALINQDIVNFDIAKNVEIWKLVDWKTVLEVFYKLYNVVKCDFDNDYDCDWITNFDDNCPHEYNSNQTDTDTDWVWDVCDDDINGDWIKNPIWIVDDNGRVNIRLRDKLTDKNFIQNSGLDNQRIWIYIDIWNVKWNAPLTVNFEAKTQWKVNKISRDMWDNTQLEWKKIIHTFTNPWMYKIKANAYWDLENVDAMVSLLVWENVKNQNWLYIVTDKIWGMTENTEILFETRNVWDLDQIKWNFGDWVEISKKPWQRFKRILNKKWTYLVIAKWYKWDELQSIASVNIWVGNNSQWASLKSNVSNPNIGQKIRIDTKIRWFDIIDIQNIETNRWDWSKTSSKWLIYEHVYRNWWIKTISQKIILKNWTSITNYITIYVVDLNFIDSYAYNVKSNNTVVNSYDKVDISTHVIGKILPNYPLLVNTHNLYETSMFPEISSRPQKFEHIYNNKWSYNFKSNLYVNQCVDMESKITVWVKWTDVCMDSMLQWTIWQFKCDMDKDWIPDICDDDIDWDWVKNIIWIIKYEHPNCSIWNYLWEDGVSRNNVDINLLKKHIWVCSLDNAFPIANNDQMDLNLNWIWDIFEDDIRKLLGNLNNFNEKFNDRDGDWVADHLDLCPDIPENYNLFQDWDGCPEIWINQNCDIRLQFPNLWWLVQLGLNNIWWTYTIWGVESSYNSSWFNIDWTNLNGTNFDDNGFDINWYDKDGYDKDWYSKDWYDKDGYDKDWFDKYWFDIDWIHLNWTKFDNNGFDVNWFDIDGYDKDWFDKYWFDIDWIHLNWTKFDNNGFDVNWFDIDGWNKNWIFDINNWALSTTSPDVVLDITTYPKAIYMRFSNDCTNRSNREDYSSSKNWILSPGYWSKKVCVQFDFDGDKNPDTQTLDDIIYSNIISNISGNILINNWALSTTSPDVVLDIATYPKAIYMRFSNDLIVRSDREKKSEKKDWNLQWKFGTKTVYVQFDFDGDKVFDIVDRDSINYINIITDIIGTWLNYLEDEKILLWIGDNIMNIPAIIQAECFQCPCSFSDIMNDLSKKDAVRASLWDKIWNILYRVSNSKSLDLNMK